MCETDIFGKKSLGVVSEHSTDNSFFRSVHRNVHNSNFFKILQQSRSSRPIHVSLGVSLGTCETVIFSKFLQEQCRSSRPIQVSFWSFLRNERIVISFNYRTKFLQEQSPKTLGVVSGMDLVNFFWFVLIMLLGQ